MSEHGYGWWQAADERWYPPEQHPSHNPNDSTSYGWWQAADGNSYPPNRHPEYRAGPAASTPAAPFEAAATMPPPAAPAATMPPPAAPTGPPPPGAPPAAPGGKALTPTIIGVLVAAVLIIVGSVLPWATIDLGFISQSIGGLDGDGGLTIVLGLATGALAFLSKGRKIGFAIGAVAAAAVCALIAVIDIADVTSTFNGAGLDAGVSVGIGLWLVLIASLGALAAGIKLIIDCRR